MSMWDEFSDQVGSVRPAYRKYDELEGCSIIGTIKEYRQNPKSKFWWVLLEQASIRHPDGREEEILGVLGLSQTVAWTDENKERIHSEGTKVGIQVGGMVESKESTYSYRDVTVFPMNNSKVAPSNSAGTVSAQEGSTQDGEGLL